MYNKYIYVYIYVVCVYICMYIYTYVFIYIIILYIFIYIICVKINRSGITIISEAYLVFRAYSNTCCGAILGSYLATFSR